MDWLQNGFKSELATTSPLEPCQIDWHPNYSNKFTCPSEPRQTEWCQNHYHLCNNVLKPLEPCQTDPLEPCHSARHQNKG